MLVLADNVLLIKIMQLNENTDIRTCEYPRSGYGKIPVKDN